MTTPNDLIARALRKSGVNGVGQAPSAEDLSDALADLNAMLGQWQRKRYLVYHLVDIAKVGTGQASYTIGPGGDFDTGTAGRPDSIASAFVRQITGNPLQVDTPLMILTAREDYNRIPVKGLGSVPLAVYLDADYPMGTVFVWPAPSSQWEIHLTVKAPLPGFTTAFDTITLPPEYEEAILYNLAARLRPSYQLPPDPTITALALSSLETIRTANAQIPRAQMPRTLMGHGRYNIYGDFER